MAAMESCICALIGFTARFGGVKDRRWVCAWRVKLESKGTSIVTWGQAAGRTIVASMPFILGLMPYLVFDVTTRGSGSISPLPDCGCGFLWRFLMRTAVPPSSDRHRAKAHPTRELALWLLLSGSKPIQRSSKVSPSSAAVTPPLMPIARYGTEEIRLIRKTTPTVRPQKYVSSYWSPGGIKTHDIAKITSSAHDTGCSTLFQKANSISLANRLRR